MTEQELAALASWIADVGLEGAAETALMRPNSLSLARSCSSIHCTPFTKGGCFVGNATRPRRRFLNMGAARMARPLSAGAEVRTTDCWKLANR